VDAICHECDLLVNIGQLTAGCKTVFPRCGYTITREHRNAIDRILVFSLTALLFLQRRNFSILTHSDLLCHLLPRVRVRAASIRQISAGRATLVRMSQHDSSHFRLMIAAGRSVSFSLR
jgi:hypothetical protein